MLNKTITLAVVNYQEALLAHDKSIMDYENELNLIPEKPNRFVILDKLGDIMNDLGAKVSMAMRLLNAALRDEIGE